MSRPPLPPFTEATAHRKVRLAEDAWNERDPAKVALAYSAGSDWRNRAEFLSGREEIVAFLTRKWAREHDYRLIKELWAFAGDRIAVMTAGAYGAVQGSTYNTRPLAAEVLVDGDRFAVVRPRQSYDALIGMDAVPDWLA